MTRKFPLTTLVRASALALVVVAATGNSPAHADDNLRCGSKLVSAGMTQVQVRQACGEPTSTEVEEVPVYVKNKNGSVRKTGTTIIEYWTYDRGSNSFPARLKFEEGQLISIELQRR